MFLGLIGSNYQGNTYAYPQAFCRYIKSPIQTFFIMSKKKMTTSDAARIQKNAAKKGNGKVSKKSFPARAAKAAAKNKNTGGNKK